MLIFYSSTITMMHGPINVSTLRYLNYLCRVHLKPSLDLNPNLFEFIATFTLYRVLLPLSISLGMVMVSEMFKYVNTSSLKKKPQQKVKMYSVSTLTYRVP